MLDIYDKIFIIMQILWVCGGFGAFYYYVTWLDKKR